MNDLFFNMKLQYNEFFSIGVNLVFLVVAIYSRLSPRASPTALCSVYELVQRGRQPAFLGVDSQAL